MHFKRLEVIVWIFDVGVYEVFVPSQCVTCSRWPSVFCLCVDVARTRKEAVRL